MRKYGKWLLVLAVLAAVPGVANADGLLDGFRPKPAVTSSTDKKRNQQHAEQVKAALQEAHIDGYGIGIEVVDGVVKLSGKVRNPAHRTRAADACRNLKGITKVVNNLQYVPEGKVRPAAATLLDLTRRSKPQDPAQPVIQQVSAQQAGPSNQQVAEQIGGALKQSGLAGMPIGITYKNGVVQLSGSVNSMAQRSAAAQAAGQVPGVRAVQNDLQVPMPIQQGIPPQYAQQMAQASMARPAAPAGYPQQGPPMTAMSQPSPQMTPVSAGPAAIGGAGAFSHPHLPSHAWPAYAQYPNSAAVTYPTQYSASAFPYIGPFYPYPQVPLGWREAKLEWDDGFWNLNFNKQQDVWHVLFHPWEKD